MMFTHSRWFFTFPVSLKKRKSENHMFIYHACKTHSRYAFKNFLKKKTHSFITNVNSIGNGDKCLKSYQKRDVFFAQNGALRLIYFNDVTNIISLFLYNTALPSSSPFPPQKNKRSKPATHDSQLLISLHTPPPHPPPPPVPVSPFPLKSVYEFVRGEANNRIDKNQFYRKLDRTPDRLLPWHCGPVTISRRGGEEGGEEITTWLISNALGGGRAKDQAVSAENRARGFVPWAGVAMRLGGGGEGGEVEGRAFCFLPLPLKIGLPVHVNGYFELSSNRYVASNRCFR